MCPQCATGSTTQMYCYLVILDYAYWAAAAHVEDDKVLRIPVHNVWFENGYNVHVTRFSWNTASIGDQDRHGWPPANVVGLHVSRKHDVLRLGTELVPPCRRCGRAANASSASTTMYVEGIRSALCLLARNFQAASDISGISTSVPTQKRQFIPPARNIGRRPRPLPLWSIGGLGVPHRLLLVVRRTPRAFPAKGMWRFTFIRRRHSSHHCR